MSFITADDAMLARLAGLLQPVEIRDGDGNVLGHYAPSVSPELTVRYEQVKALFDRAEAEHAAAPKEPGMTTPELMRWLKSLENGDALHGDMDARCDPSTGGPLGARNRP